MKFLIDFFPTLIFFAFFKWMDIYVATAALMVSAVAQMLLLRFLRYSIEKMHWITLGFVGVFGSLTLIFHNDSFIKWKVTIIYLVFATILFASAQFYKKNILQSMLGKEIQVPMTTWNRINGLWVGFCLLCAGLNLFVAYTFSQEAWVHFKLFGLMGMTLLCSLVTGYLLMRSQSTSS